MFVERLCCDICTSLVLTKDAKYGNDGYTRSALCYCSSPSKKTRLPLVALAVGWARRSVGVNLFRLPSDRHDSVQLSECRFDAVRRVEKLSDHLHRLEHARCVEE